jgi:hypothetical protein
LYYHYAGDIYRWDFLDRLGVKGTKHNKDLFIAGYNAAEKEAWRNDEKAQKWGVTLKQWRAGIHELREHFPHVSNRALFEMKEKAQKVVWNYRNTDYSMGSETYLTVDGVIIAVYDNREEYARSSKWRAKHGYTEIKMSINDLRRIEKANGVWVVKNRKHAKNHKAKGLSASGKYSDYKVRFVDCYINGNSVGKTPEDARRADMEDRINKIEWSHKYLSRAKDMIYNSDINIDPDYYHSLGVCPRYMVNVVKPLIRVNNGITPVELARIVSEMDAYTESATLSCLLRIAYYEMIKRGEIE